MKTCTKCLIQKSITDFYPLVHMKDGHFSACKECVKARVKKRREENIEYVREYDRRRGALEHRKENNRKVAALRKLNPDNAEKDRVRTLKWKENNQKKRACHVLVGHAIRSGKLIQKDCEKCGEKKEKYKIHAHHEDYDYPLDVVWLCRKCHGARHKEINEEKRKNEALQNLSHR